MNASNLRSAERPRRADYFPAGELDRRLGEVRDIDYLQVARVARLLDVGKKRVYNLIQEGRLRAVRLGERRMRVSRASLEAYLRRLDREGLEEFPPPPSRPASGPVRPARP